jgi:glycerol-1-phosphate dehydrogenase [NAD(P)+]
MSGKALLQFVGRNKIMAECEAISDQSKNILKDVKCFILDMDGTFYLGNRLIAGSLDFIELLKKCSKGFYFYTNNSSKNAGFYQNKLRGMGCDLERDKIIVSNDVIIEHLKKCLPDKKIFLLGTEYLLSDFVNAGIEVVEDNADVVVVGFDTSLRYERVAKACDFIRHGKQFMAIHQDLNCPTEDGFIPDCGSICAMITASTGITPTFFGKPTKHTLQYILNKTGYKENEIVFIGDRLYTDIAIGDGNEAFTMLVLTGETKEDDLAQSKYKPTLVFSSLLEIKNTLQEIYYGNCSACPESD